MKVRILVLAVVMILSSVIFSYADEKRYSLPIENSPSYGPADAPVTIIEFLDYQ
ncbi:MAG: DsbA family protein [Nitrospiraceae bacterium]|nr:DsbA family protein [Nitrospiraceae bacterium]